MANKIVHSTKADVDKRKQEIEARCVKATVTGALPIRDAVTREDIVKGGIVRLDPESTLLGALVEAGAIELIAEGKSES